MSVCLSVYNGTETISFRAQQNWDMVPDDTKNVTSLNEFMTKIRQLDPKIAHAIVYILYIIFIKILLALAFIS